MPVDPLFDSAACALAVGLKFKLGFDDALDVVGVHMIGGLTGTLLIGLFATDEAPESLRLAKDAKIHDNAPLKGRELEP